MTTSIKPALIKLEQSRRVDAALTKVYAPRRSPEMTAAVERLQSTGVLSRDYTPLCDCSVCIAEHTRRGDVPPISTESQSAETVGAAARSNESTNGDAFWTESSWWAFACGICAGLLIALVVVVASLSVTS